MEPPITFQISNKNSLVHTYAANIMRHTYTNKIIYCYLKFK